MIKKKTVFVVGAGASKDFGLPLGPGLMELIQRNLKFGFDDMERLSVGNGERSIYSALAFPQIQISPELWQAARRVSDGMHTAPSIDNYLHTHADDANAIFCGKVAIAHTILRCERASPLHFQPEDRHAIDLSRISNSWYPTLGRFLVERVKKNEANKSLDNVAFVTFNYDRCLEHYLADALPRYFTASACSELLERIRVHHVYGEVGDLPWKKSARINSEFGEDAKLKRLLELSEGIRTFTEGMLDDRRELMCRDICDAERLVFLGFSFQRDNMQLLKSAASWSNADVFATALNVPDDSVRRVKETLLDEFGVKSVQIGKLDCRGLLEAFPLGLTD